MMNNNNTWEGMDPDDVDGYLMDHLLTWFDEHDIHDQSSYDEAHQDDQFLEDKDALVDEIAKAVFAKGDL